MDKVKTADIINSLNACIKNTKCEGCMFRDYAGSNCTELLKTIAANKLESLERELTDERDRYDRLVSFELAEAAELQTLRDKCDVMSLELGGFENDTDDIPTDARAEAYIAEKHLQLDDTPDQHAKADAGKPKLTLVPRRIIYAIARVREYGNRKCGDPENWRTVDKERYRDAAFRHLLAYLDDPQGVDAESGLRHLDHLACNIAFLAELEG